MPRRQYLGTTTYIRHPQWKGDGFAHPDANAYWSVMPQSLKEIAAREIAAGNTVQQILRNPERNIVLVAFERGPLTDIPMRPLITVHTQHQYGNYCYDGTKCTYEDQGSGCFLAFHDPEWQDDAF
jgi:hypothetical protein